MELNQKQRQAVEAGDGRNLVIAGAGAGKTKVLTERIRFLIEQGANPCSILAITFTNKAANEMKERIRKGIGQKADQIWLGTFHSVCARLIRTYGHRIGIRSNFTILDDTDNLEIVKTILKESPDQQLNDERIRAALSFITHCVNNNITPDPETVNGKIFVQYFEKLRASNVLDFDALIYYAVMLLRDDPGIGFTHVLVDEFQDTNLLQMEFANLVSKVHGNLFVVSDDSQSIYSWRYATIDNVINLNNDDRTSRYVLDQNYRCTGTILEAANSVIQINQKQIPKQLWTENPQGEKIGLMHCANNYIEAQAICRFAKRYEGEDVTVLCRTNAQMREIEMELIRNGVLYRIFNGNSIFTYKLVKTLISYLKFIENPLDIFAFSKIINFPKRGIGEKNLNKIMENAEARKISCIEMIDSGEAGLSKKAKEEAQIFSHIIKACMDCKDDVVETVNVLLEAVDFTKSADTKDRDMLYEFIGLVDNIAKTREKMNVLDFLALCSLSYDDDPSMAGNVLKLMTIHASKGLEFNIVIIPGVEEGIMPHHASVNSTLMTEEERRLFYVALTRAKKKAILTLCAERSSFGASPRVCVPSRFLKEIPKHLLERIYF